MTATEYIIKNLPSSIKIKGYPPFVFEILHDITELRLCYITSDDNFIWINPYINYGDDGGVVNSSFLYLYEGIENDSDLLEAAQECYNFLLKNNLIYGNQSL